MVRSDSDRSLGEPSLGTVKVRLLTSALKAFAEKGFYGARIEDIVASAGVNVRMIYHYFGSKEGLYDEALLLAVMDLHRSGLACGREALDPFSRLEMAVRAYAESCLEMPLQAQLASWERSGGNAALRRIITEENDFELLLAELIEEAPLPRSLDKSLILTLLMGCPLLLASSGPGAAALKEGEAGVRRLVDSFWALASAALGQASKG